jgi:steroid 5-alpha reductase family enzyme
VENILFLKPPFSILEIFSLTGFFLFVYLSIFSLLAIAKKRADYADIAWGFGFILIAWVSFFLSGYSLYGLLVNVFVTIWGLRLSVHILQRNHHQEDFRYKKWKTKSQIFFSVFLLQGVFLWIVALPILWIQIHHKEASWNALLLASTFWISGFMLESLSDYQLTSFLKKTSNRGKLLTTGFWGYSRHPNYLGEIVQWWAIWILAAALPFGYFFLISPLLITYLIVYVSGIAPLEKKMQKHQGFAKYAKKTPMIIPSSAVNGLLYTISYMIIMFYGVKGSFFIPLITAIVCYIAQLILLSYFEKHNIWLCIFLSLIALSLGTLQEMGFVYFKLLTYPKHIFLSPFWVLSLYPLLSLTLHSSLAFLKKHTFIAFLLGGIGANAAYLSGEAMRGVILFWPLSCPIIFFSWGFLLVILVLLNKKLEKQFQMS